MPSVKRKQPEPKGKIIKKQDSSTTTEPGPAVSFKSSLINKREEVSFPRGGASVLTPLEYKEVANEAVRDVLFESSQPSKKVKTSSDSSTAPSYNGKQDKHSRHRERVTQRKLRDQQKNGKKDGTKNNSESAKISKIKIEGVTFKRLVPGTIVLGQVASIGAYELALSLPNNLTGYVPITNISAQISKKLEAVEQSEDEDDENKDEDEDDETDKNVPDLKTLFSIGQWLRAVVTERKSDNDGTAKSKKHIELSIKPEIVNSSIDKADLVKSQTVQVSVASAEDHGAILDVGIDDLSGFISNKELEYSDFKQIKEGQTLLLTVLNKSSNGRTLTFTATAVAKNLPPISVVQNVDSLVPGTVVDFVPSQVTSGGLAGKAASGLVDGTVDLFHAGLHNDADIESNQDKYKSGQKLRARIISYLPGADEHKKVKLSLLPHVVNLSSTEAAVLVDSLPVGHHIPAAKVIAVEPGMGVFVDTGVGRTAGFAHISRLSDDHVAEISAEFGEYKTGTVHAARVTGHALADGVALVSLQASVLAQRYLRLEDVAVGDVITDGKIVKILPAGGLLVSVSDKIVGHVNEQHLSDVKVSQPERRFRPGQVVRVRVLNVQPDTRRVRLTLKKSLVSAPEDKVARTYEGVHRGQRLVGTVINLVSKGAIVEFFGTVTGFLPLTEMSEVKISSPGEKFKVGQTVDVRVVSVHAEYRKMRVSTKEKKERERKKSDPKKKGEKKKEVAEAEEDKEEEELSDGQEEVDEDKAEDEDKDEDEDEELEFENDDDDDDDDDDNNDNDDDEGLEESLSNKDDKESPAAGLTTSGFNWSSGLDDQVDDNESGSSEEEDNEDENDHDDGDSGDEDKRRKQERRRRRAEKARAKLQQDQDVTGELSNKEPESVHDFERLLIGSPNSSALWIRFMAFEVQLGEIEKARQVARRALRTINFRLENEKINVWTGLLNLEHSFGTADTLEATFKESCVYMDPDVMAKRLQVIKKQRAAGQR
ncbi:hypothetical protein V1514DRAFT_323987 [Lipomyces japonicus]|uniref:uncharacterized protein n=1 Tax=Lipomyces japonicus TaxID=56871 RepID=UPI0034CD6557